MHKAVPMLFAVYSGQAGPAGQCCVLVLQTDKPFTFLILEVNSAIKTATPSSVAANIALLATCSTCNFGQGVYSAFL